MRERAAERGILRQNRIDSDDETGSLRIDGFLLDQFTLKNRRQ
jgi:hypothetical protein